jgi:hypothetical protein
MANTDDNNEQTNKIPYAGKMDPALHAVIERFRIEEDRGFTPMVERLLKTHPRVQPLLETAETAAA